MTIEGAITATLAAGILGYLLLAPMIARIMAETRRLGGIVPTLIAALAISYAWELVLVGAVLLDRLVPGLRLPAWFVLALALTVAAQPWLLHLLLARWRWWDRDH